MRRIRKYLFKTAACCLLFSCNQPIKENQTNTAGNATPRENLATTEMCFRQVTGQQNQDTAWVHLVLKNEKVTGAFLNLPHEKDSRKGTLSGTKQGNNIRATWTFMQEGQTDSLPVQFKVTGNQLQQKPYVIDSLTGREILAESTEYTLLFEQINCNGSPFTVK